MRCCGCFGRSQKQEREGHGSDEDSPQKTEDSGLDRLTPAVSNRSSPALDGRASLKSIRSSNTVYFDCQDTLDAPSLSLGSDNSDSKEFSDVARDSELSNGGAELLAQPSKRSRAVGKLLAKSLQVGEHKGTVDGIGQYEHANPEGFMVRGKDYMQTSRKVKAKGEVYRLIGCDVYQHEHKINHIAQYIDLPTPPNLSKEHCSLPPEQQLPPLLVINIQLPLYKAGLIRGATDGKGVNIVQYFALPGNFRFQQLENDAAIGLLQRLVTDGEEANGEKTRNRLKLVARVVNVEEWAERAPLAGHESSILWRYNDKPILTRPQHHFFNGQNYLEIDLDVHCYAWPARKTLSGFLPRLGSVVFEDALIVQGNAAEELPEVVMACARVSHLDFSKAKPFPAEILNKKADGLSDTAEHALHASTFPDDDIDVPLDATPESPS